MPPPVFSSPSTLPSPSASFSTAPPSEGPAALAPGRARKVSILPTGSEAAQVADLPRGRVALSQRSARVREGALLKRRCSRKRPSHVVWPW